MKVFVSWQPDTPARIGRNFIRDAVKEAVEQLKLQVTIDEAQRGSRTAPLSEDDGSSGSPAELKELLKSLGEAATVVADVTPLGQALKVVDGTGTSAVRKFIDSDVAFEIGYGSHLLGDRKVVLLFNAHYGWHDDMPINLRNRGGAIAFTLVPNAARPEIEVERKKLVTKLVVALSQSLNAAPTAVGGSGLPSAAGNRGAYFRSEEVLATSGKQGAGEINYSYASDTLCYLRLIPLPPLERPLPLASLRKVVDRAPLLSRQPEGAMIGRNDYGAVAFEPSTPPSRGPGNLSASTQLFITGEIWSIGSSLIARERGDRPQWIKLPFLSSVIFERVYYDHLRFLTRFALEQLSLSAPWEVECGVSGSKGLHLWVSAQETSGPIVQSDVISRRTMKSGSEEEMDAILLEFFNLLHAAAGAERPQGMHGFPPGRPR
jgi:hypothetical protein